MERNIELIAPDQRLFINKNIDKELVKKRFAKVIKTYEKEAYIQKQIAAKMISLISHYIHQSCENILEIGCGTGFLSIGLEELFQPENFTLNDLCPEMENRIKEVLNSKYIFLAGDAEDIPFPQNPDGIFSCSTFQWFLNIKDFFTRCHAALTSNGYLAFSTFGKENMKEIASITGNNLPYHSLKELQQMLVEEYELIYSEEEKIELFFNSPLEILHHLKLTGVNGVANTDRTWNKKRLSEFCEQYQHVFGNKNKLPLTYHPIYMICRKKELPPVTPS